MMTWKLQRKVRTKYSRLTFRYKTFKGAEKHRARLLFEELAGWG